MNISSAYDVTLRYLRTHHLSPPTTDVHQYRLPTVPELPTVLYSSLSHPLSLSSRSLPSFTLIPLQLFSYFILILLFFSGTASLPSEAVVGDNIAKVLAADYNNTGKQE